MPEPLSPLAAPQSCRHLFVVFTRLTMQGFGGVLPVAQRVLCEQQRWLTPAQFLETLGVAQLLPGPNVCNLSLMIGDRYFGWRGALAALAGMLALPLVLVLLLAAGVASLSGQAWVGDALRGMGAVSAGLIAGTGFKLAAGLQRHPLGRLGVVALVAATFGAIVLARWPLVAVLPALAPASVAACWWRLRQAPEATVRRPLP